MIHLISGIILTAVILGSLFGIIALATHIGDLGDRKQSVLRATHWYNKLRQCNACNRYFRMYQGRMRLLIEHKGQEEDCAHCGSGNTNPANGVNDLFKLHRDCPYISERQRYRMWKRFVKINEINKNLRDLDELQIYERRRKVGGEL